MTPLHPNLTIQPLQYADVDACAQIARDCFAVDPHTFVKQLGRDGYDVFAIARADYLDNLERDMIVFVKAVDDDATTGKILGYCGWAFPHVDKARVPRSPPRDAKPIHEPAKKTAQEAQRGQTEEKSSRRRELDAIDRLHALEDADMKDWQRSDIPDGEPCMFVMGLAVAPGHQSRGIGSALLRHGNRIADELGVPVWVHSSHQAVDAYAKAGFKPVRTLAVDLDEYAPRPPRDDEPVMGDKGSGKWGVYVIEYMKREPSK